MDITRWSLLSLSLFSTPNRTASVPCSPTCSWLLGLPGMLPNFALRHTFVATHVAMEQMRLNTAAAPAERTAAWHSSSSMQAKGISGLATTTVMTEELSTGRASFESLFRKQVSHLGTCRYFLLVVMKGDSPASRGLLAVLKALRQGTGRMLAYVIH